ncbi:YjbE family integral membrane protein [Rhodopseudomonas julia]|uniref:YjbE family integral membrane protein n=1 Tax=Rhodopseudomonas julia TaxID=200617 RepID=A0ABU0C7G5_9BRAD|nr:YjbE family putative metal transport protein [Rhodopseudomonas julia]MDQ0326177.1 YjbE family integral membrane protein [Rhodopseudomonas julia]
MWEGLLALLSIVWLDVVLSGDNALVIGLAASALPPQLRRPAILCGIGLAATIRILGAILFTYLLGIPGIVLAGGLLLLWVCWRLYRDVGEKGPTGAEMANAKTTENERQADGAGIMQALVSIAVADVSMSIDNVFAVASISRGNALLLVFGLVLSIALMALAASLIVKLLVRHRWISYVGLVFLVYVAGGMIWEGGIDLATAAHLPLADELSDFGDLVLLLHRP